MKDLLALSTQQIKKYIEALDDSIDDYLYIFDIPNDYYCISPHATERFALENSEFHNVMENHLKFVYRNDIDILKKDLDEIVHKEKMFHNLQYRWLGKDGLPVWINCRGQLLLDEEGNPRFLAGCINEIGRRQKADNTSNLLKANVLWHEFFSNPEEFQQGYMLRLGIDDFKDINENHGMEFGNLILKRTAESIKRVIQDPVRLFRIDADEFLVFSKNGGKKEAKELYQQIRKSIQQSIEENGYESYYTISGGILDLNQEKSNNYSELWKWIEFALSHAKKLGKNQYYVFEKETYHQFLHKKKMTHVLFKAVNYQFEGFDVHYQPVVNVEDNSIYSVEALLRFHCEEFGNIKPLEFIPLLEESGLIIPVGKWVIDQAARMCRLVHDQMPNLKVQVNLSYIQILKSDVISEILQSVKENNLPNDCFSVELTESGYIEKNQNFVRFHNDLKKHGIPLALDDFGTGYSNFNYLYDLQPDTIKIDRSMTMKALKNDYERLLLKHMIEMAHSVNAKICIEGIEAKEELDEIVKMNPDFIQGYYYGRPCSQTEFMKRFVDSSE